VLGGCGIEQRCQRYAGRYEYRCQRYTGQYEFLCQHRRQHDERRVAEYRYRGLDSAMPTVGGSGVNGMQAGAALSESVAFVFLKNLSGCRRAERLLS
jgi:hypothetical protein